MEKSTVTTVIHIGHPGFLPKMVVYCIHKHIKDPIFLVDITFASVETKTFLNQWNNCNSDFGRLYTFTDSRFWVESDEKSLEKEIIKFFDEKLKLLDIDICNVSQMYSAYDGLSAFGVFCCIKNKKFRILSFDGIPFDIAHENCLYTISQVGYKPEAETYLSLLRKYRVLSIYCPMVESIICIGKHPIDARCENFDYVGIINSMDDLLYKSLSKLFQTHFNYQSFDYIVPLRSYSSVKYSGITFSDKQEPSQKLLTVYRKLLDHILGPNDKVLFKAHPNFGIPENVLKTIPNSSYLPGYYPSEFVNKDLMDACYICIGGSTASMLGKGYLLLPESFFSVGNIINPFMATLKIMEEISAYPIKSIDNRLELYRPIIDLKLKKSLSGYDSLLIDAKHTPIDVIHELLNDAPADVIFILNPTEYIPGCRIYHVNEISDGNYREEYTGAPSNFYIEIFNNNQLDLAYPENIKIPMVRCGSILLGKLDTPIGNLIEYTGLPSVELDLGRAYRDGTYLHQNIIKAADFMFSA